MQSPLLLMTQAAHNYPVESDMTSKRIKTLEFYFSYFRDVVQSIMGKLHLRKPVDFCFFLQLCNRKKKHKAETVCLWLESVWHKIFQWRTNLCFCLQQMQVQTKAFPFMQVTPKNYPNAHFVFWAAYLFFLSSPNSAPVIFWLHCLYCVSNI